MNELWARLRVLFANLAWLLTCLPGWAAFLIGIRNVKRAQLKTFTRILRANAQTRLGRRHRFGGIVSPDDFRAVPLSEYEDYVDEIYSIQRGAGAELTSDPVEILQPTSGSTAATKLIPCTHALRQEFKAAIDPWIASLYFAFPALLFGRHYWSISPSTQCTPLNGEFSCKVTIGFADDSEYLGFAQRLLARALFAVPAEIARVADHAAFEYLTLLFLCRERHLRLISVWHPSFLTLLLRALPARSASIIRDIQSGVISESLDLSPELKSVFSARFAPHPVRAHEVARIDFSKPDWPQCLWPGLRLISCWTDGTVEPWRSELAKKFPRAFIQGKGLAATEGIVSFPWGRSGKKICAINSHYLEFIDPATGASHNAWDVKAGAEYSVAMTTGGGLYRYLLHDLVRVSGFLRQAPCLDFIARDNVVSDLVGEKLNARHVEESIRHMETALGVRFTFSMLAPIKNGDRAGYVLYVQDEGDISLDFKRTAVLMEEELEQNYHYRHARRLGQLEAVRLFHVAGDAETAYRRHLVERGMKLGDIKFQALSPDQGWGSEFNGNYSSG